MSNLTDLASGSFSDNNRRALIAECVMRTGILFILPVNETVLRNPTEFCGHIGRDYSDYGCARSCLKEQQLYET